MTKIFFILTLVLVLVSCASTSKISTRAIPPTPEVPAPRIHFTTNSDQLDDDVKRLLDDNAAWLASHERAVVVLEGHCDEWGDESYNMFLGDRRARQVKADLVARGIDPDRMIMIVSYGEKRPLDPTHTMDAWRKNRRVEFIVR